MHEERVCRRCLLRESGREETLADIQTRIARLSPAERAPQTLYDARLAVCTGCADLIGGVCVRCGCYPEFRAAFRRQTCPMRRWPKDIQKRKEESL
ncbi:MAG: hypothetical protein IK080_07875 [Clostridia bacterium]|nr:hypothetical protein [Clostridia bacterium]